MYDIWEVEGYHADEDEIVDVDLPAMGADRYRKDIFVEIDYMEIFKCSETECELHSHFPNPDAIEMIINSFNNAPICEPPSENCKRGIALHVDFGEDQIMTGENF